LGLLIDGGWPLWLFGASKQRVSSVLCYSIRLCDAIAKLGVYCSDCCLLLSQHSLLLQATLQNPASAVIAAENAATHSGRGGRRWDALSSR
jgi:hypothetical protein